MTQWLPINTYPYDGTWGLFRGGQIEAEVTDRNAQSLPYVMGTAFHFDYVAGTHSIEHAHVNGIASGFDAIGGAVYYGATEWLPLSILDMLEDHHVTAARLLL